MSAASAFSGEYIIPKEESGRFLQLVALIRQHIQCRCLEVEKHPGLYRWWFPETEAMKLLARFKSPMLCNGRTLNERIIDGSPYLALYFGISGDMSRRIRWHISGPFKSSTLRRTLHAIMVSDADDKTANSMVNQLIDSCYLEWQYTDSMEQAERRETEELAQKEFAYPLNISKNDTVPAEWITELKQLRADLKNK
jgi:DNA-binding transcriptional regulator YiaG